VPLRTGLAGSGAGGFVVVRADSAGCASGLSGGGGVVTLRTGLTGGGGGLASVVTLRTELAAIGGGSSFVQTWSAGGADPVIDSGSGEGGGDAGVEAPPRFVVIAGHHYCTSILVSCFAASP